MKELIELENWADKIIIGEAETSQRMGTPMKGAADRPLPRQIDIQYKAQRAHPELSPEQALALYMSDELVDKEKMDLAQNKLINTVKRDNEKLRRTLDELGTELTNHEAEAQKTDQEVARLKDLSAKLKPEGELQQQRVKVSRDELQKLEDRINELKDKPGMDDKKFNDLKTKVEQMAQLKSLNDKDVKTLENLLAILAGKQGISDELYNKTMNQLVDTQEKLDAKEKRFSAYIERKGKEIVDVSKGYASELHHYSNIINRYKDDITDFEKDMRQGRAEINKGFQQIQSEVDIVRKLRGDLQQEVDKVQSTSDEVSKILNYLNNFVQSNPAIKTQQTIDKAKDQQQRQDINVDQYVNENINIVNEEVRVSRHWEDPEFDEWMQKNLYALVRIFQNYYKKDLALKNPTYSNSQIAYKIENFAHWIENVFNSDDPVLTKEKMETFMAAVKASLFREPVEPHQSELFNESLDVTYERMLDTIVESCFTKNHTKK